MSIRPEVLDALLAAGCSAEQIVAAVKADLEGAEARLAVKRARDAERQRKSRAIRAKSQPVTVTPRDSADGDTAPYIEIPPVSPKGDTAPQGAKRSRGSRISPDWQPPAKQDLPPEARALAQGWSDASYRTEAEGFRNYWLGESGARASKANWNTAWANRIVQANWRVLKDQRGSAPPKPGNDYLEGLLAKKARGP